MAVFNIALSTWNTAVTAPLTIANMLTSAMTPTRAPVVRRNQLTTPMNDNTNIGAATVENRLPTNSAVRWSVRKACRVAALASGAGGAPGAKADAKVRKTATSPSQALIVWN